MSSALGRVLLCAVLAAGGAACGGDAGDEGTVRLYTSVTQDTVDAVVAGFAAAHPGLAVAVFRAPTGELAARIASEQREGGLQADVLWLTDPLSIQQYDRDGLLRAFTPAGIENVPGGFRTGTFFGTRVLNLVIVAGDALEPAPRDWGDLAAIPGGVAIPDPGFAGSAFAALGYFALHPDFGVGFYDDLHDAGAEQVRSPGDVVAGVAEGVYAAGITLDRTVRDAVADGSPVQLIWPASGAIAVYSPIAVVTETGGDSAEEFVAYVIGEEGQRAIAATGWEPVHPAVEWPDAGAQQLVDWEQAFDRQEDLLDQYRAVFGE